MSQNNRSAGELTNLINRRHKFADWTRQKQAALLGLRTPTQIQGGNTSRNQVGVYGAVIEGAQYTTAAEQASYVAEVNDSVIPDAPANVVATAGNGQATITFSIPYNGGLPITSYTVTSSPEGLTATGSDSPITITGLANGETYTFTVYATNAAGNSVTSTPSAAITLTGGTITTTPFTTVGSTTWSAPALRSVVEYLIVGGGGGGGGGFDTGGGGGGGAGMVLTGTFRSGISETYTVVVGAGGAASTNAYPSAPFETAGGDGASSSLDTIIALGGGGGKASRTQTDGSGAGGAAQTAVAAAIGGSGGGNLGSSAGGSGGGGGGASENGGNGTAAAGGTGGAGISSSISGSATTYGAGGNGARGNTIITGAAGTANRGNGGGGGGFSFSGARNSGAGGSGIVIIRYYAQP